MFKPLPCMKCYNLGYCKKMAVPLLTVQELTRPEIIRGIKSTAYSKR